MKYRVGRKNGTVILDELGSVVTEFVYNKIEGEAQRLAHEYVDFKNSQEQSQLKWRPASEAPYDEICIFKAVEGYIVEGFIYDGDEKDFGYTHFIPMPVD
jgi:hypothetical protein